MLIEKCGKPTDLFIKANHAGRVPGKTMVDAIATEEIKAKAAVKDGQGNVISKAVPAVPAKQATVGGQFMHLFCVSIQVAKECIARLAHQGFIPIDDKIISEKDKANLDRCFKVTYFCIPDRQKFLKAFKKAKSKEFYNKVGHDAMMVIKRTEAKEKAAKVAEKEISEISKGNVKSGKVKSGKVDSDGATNSEKAAMEATGKTLEQLRVPKKAPKKSPKKNKKK